MVEGEIHLKAVLSRTLSKSRFPLPKPEDKRTISTLRPSKNYAQMLAQEFGMASSNTLQTKTGKSARQESTLTPLRFQKREALTRQACHALLVKRIKSEINF